jgi:hypothetical protein
VKICNTSEYPLKYLVISTKAIIDDRVTPSDKPNYVPGIIAKGGITDVRFNSYARGRLSKPGLNRGTLELTYRYGHASKGFVFESQRVYALRCSLPDSEKLAEGPPANMIPVEMIVQSEQDDLLPISG